MQARNWWWLIGFFLLGVLICVPLALHGLGIDRRAAAGSFRGINGPTLPSTVTHEGALETPRDVTVTIAPSGAYYYNGKLVTLPQMKALLTQAAARDKSQRVLLKGDKSVSYKQVMDVMGAIRQAGLTHVLLPVDVNHAARAGGTGRG